MTTAMPCPDAAPADPGRGGEDPGPAGETAVDAARCRGLLAVGRLGRIVYTRGALPECRPVSYAWDRGLIVFAVGDPGVAHAIVANAVAAFETDGVDAGTRVAWTVLAVGDTSEIDARSEVARLRRRLHGVWAAVPSARLLALRPRRLTGVQVGCS